jgi:ribokinase
MGGRKASVFFGDVALDSYYAAPHFPAAGDKIIVEALPAQFGGMVANAAAIYAHYGMPTSFMSQLNSGPLTRKLLAPASQPMSLASVRCGTWTSA